MLVRVTAMVGLIAAKALVGQEAVTPIEIVANVAEIGAIFAAGIHFAHMKGSHS